MSLDTIRDQIIELLGRRDYRPMDRVELGKSLKVQPPNRKLFRMVLGDLEDAGLIVRIRKDRYILPEAADLVTGVIRFAVNGNARIDGPSEVFIPAAETGLALHGDRVVVRLMDDRRGRGKPDQIYGKVIRILERPNDQVVGTLQRSKHVYYVVPDEPRMVHNICVEPALGARVGDKVVARLEPWTDPQLSPEAEIIEVLGPSTSPKISMVSVIRRFGLPTEFPEGVLQEAAAIPEKIPEAEIARREDFRETLIVTIDPDDARDHDDAIHVERLPARGGKGGGWRLGVHIADVAHYVPRGSKLDEEAKRRGNSTYLADRVMPMLPERLSNGICSLKEGVDRLAFAAILDIGLDGKIRKARFAKTIIRSAARLAYKQAFAILKGKKTAGIREDVAEAVRTAWELASVLRKKRFENGSLDLDFPEVKVWCDEEGYPTKIERIDNDISHQLVEECMLAANEAVAREIKNRSVPGVYRVHEQPEPKKLEEFRDFAKSLGHSFGDLTNRTEVLRMFTSIKGKPEAHSLKFAFLRSLQKAVYGVQPLGHYGLAKVNYTHFTSPIRRYADLIVHRVLAGDHSASAGQLSEVCKHISITERVSSEAERESVQLKKIEYFLRQLESRRPQEFRAIITDVRPHGLVIDLPDIGTSGMIHVSALPGDFYEFDPGKMSFYSRRQKRRFKVGDELDVVVGRVDPVKRHLDFIPVD